MHNGLQCKISRKIIFQMLISNNSKLIPGFLQSGAWACSLKQSLVFSEFPCRMQPPEQYAEELLISLGINRERIVALDNKQYNTEPSKNKL